ncbi:MAG TPA: PocR ligand-binding domain-containing protein [Dongiaceae bacterium]|nr:PocR ligand-binding domain-containing protein [Dongiaceae bacterium]
MFQERNGKLTERFSRTQIFQDYERAFTEATGLPLSLRPAEVWQPVHRSKKNENPFCALMTKESRTCAACLEVQQKLAESPETGTKHVTCFAGLCDTAVPVQVENQIIGYLQTGQVFLKKPSQKQFAKTAKQLVEWGMNVDLRELEEAYFHTRVLRPEQYEAMVRLLTIFAQHLSVTCNQILMQKRNAEPPKITKAKQFIEERQADDISLTDVARAVNTSSFYFCKMFKKATGLNFTDYLSRVRIEKAKNLLLNPNLRVSEVAYEVGFQSLTHFNRVFRKLCGVSPTEYRVKLPKP